MVVEISAPSVKHSGRADVAGTDVFRTLGRESSLSPTCGNRNCWLLAKPILQEHDASTIDELSPHYRFSSISDRLFGAKAQIKWFDHPRVGNSRNTGFVRLVPLAAFIMGFPIETQSKILRIRETEPISIQFIRIQVCKTYFSLVGQFEFLVISKCLSISRKKESAIFALIACANRREFIRRNTLQRSSALTKYFFNGLCASDLAAGAQ